MSISIQIAAGSPGCAESMGWRDTLSTLIDNWCELNGLQRLISLSDISVDGKIKSPGSSISVYGGEKIPSCLAYETGIHSRTRYSPLDKQGRLATSYASVSVQLGGEACLEISNSVLRRYFENHGKVVDNGLGAESRRYEEIIHGDLSDFYSDGG